MVIVKGSCMRTGEVLHSSRVVAEATLSLPHLDAMSPATVLSWSGQYPQVLDTGTPTGPLPSPDGQLHDLLSHSEALAAKMALASAEQVTHIAAELDQTM